MRWNDKSPPPTPLRFSYRVVRRFLFFPKRLAIYKEGGALETHETRWLEFANIRQEYRSGWDDFSWETHNDIVVTRYTDGTEVIGYPDCGIYKGMVIEEQGTIYRVDVVHTDGFVDITDLSTGQLFTHTKLTNPMEVRQ